MQSLRTKLLVLLRVQTNDRLRGIAADEFMAALEECVDKKVQEAVDGHERRMRHEIDRDRDE